MHRFSLLSLLLTTLPLAACPDGGGDTAATPATTTGATTTDGTTAETPTTADETTTAPGTTTTGVTTTTVDPSTTTEATTGETTATTGEPLEVLILPDFETPESVHWSALADAWFVSNIVGNPGEADGNGYISRIGPDLTVTDMKWVEGLDGPAGLREAGGILYAADIDRIRAIDIETGQLVETASVPGAMFLNDIVVGPDDFVYVSDTFANAIHRYQLGNPPELVLQDASLDAPNGLIFLGDQLYIGAAGSVMDPAILGELLIIEGDVAVAQGVYEGKIDGMEVDGGDFLITEFTGQLQRVSPDGETVTLIRDFVASDGLKSTADCGFDPETRTVGIPDFLGSAVAFYTVP